MGNKGCCSTAQLKHEGYLDDNNGQPIENRRQDKRQFQKKKKMLKNEMNALIKDIIELSEADENDHTTGESNDFKTPETQIKEFENYLQDSNNKIN